MIHKDFLRMKLKWSVTHFSSVHCERNSICFRYFYVGPNKKFFLQKINLFHEQQTCESIEVETIELFCTHIDVLQKKRIIANIVFINVPPLNLKTDFSLVLQLFSKCHPHNKNYSNNFEIFTLADMMLNSSNICIFRKQVCDPWL